MYFSTEGLQKGIKVFAVSFPRLYSELKANTVSLTKPIIPSIYSQIEDFDKYLPARAIKMLIP